MSPPRDTKTGSVLEAMIIPALIQGGYEYETQVSIGNRPGGGRHLVDVIARKAGKNHIVSVKWQQVSGTAEQKVPYEVMSLADAYQKGGFDSVYLVLGGDGWSLRDFYLSDEFKSYLRYGDKVNILTLETFIGLANKGRL